MITARKRSLRKVMFLQVSVIHSVHRGGVRGFIGGHAWFYSGGMHGFISGGACMVLFRGACVVLFGGHAWFYSGGACVVLFGGHAWFYSGGMRGFIWGGVHGFIRGGMRGFFSFFGYNEIRSMSGRYASYWNAFLLYSLLLLANVLAVRANLHRASVSTLWKFLRWG